MDENQYRDELHANGFVAWEYTEQGKRTIGVYDGATLRTLGHFPTFAEAYAKLC